MHVFRKNKLTNMYDVQRIVQTILIKGYVNLTRVCKPNKLDLARNRGGELKGEKKLKNENEYSHNV